MPCGRIFEKCFNTTEKGTFKKEKMKDETFDVARTRKCAECGSDEEMWWLALHPSHNNAQINASK